MEPVVERAGIELDGCLQGKSIELHVGEVLEQDVDGVGCAVRALELLPRQNGLVGRDERVESVADHDAEVLQPHPVDALVHGRDELDERDGLAVEDLQRVYRMGLEHLGVVVGDTFDAFVGAHKPVLTGQQFQGPNSTPDPVYILFEDFTHVKFYRLSLRESVELDAGPFDDGFHHVEDWVPQRLVTATGPNPLPR